MARIFSRSLIDRQTALPEYTLIPVKLREVHVEPSKFEDGSMLVITWETADDSRLWLRDHAAVKLGCRPDGDRAKMVQLINALGGRQPHEEVKWFDDETLEYSLDGTGEALLEPGSSVHVLGKHVPSTRDADRTFFRIVAYQPVRVPVVSQPLMDRRSAIDVA